MRFEVGDIVCLAGTPMKMVVSRPRGAFTHCQWFDRECQLNEYPFQTEVLEKQAPRDWNSSEEANLFRDLPHLPKDD